MHLDFALVSVEMREDGWSIENTCGRLADRCPSIRTFLSQSVTLVIDLCCDRINAPPVSAPPS
jgi:hypothetical protein